MAERSRAERIGSAFVKMADTLVVDYDVFDLLHTLVDEAAAVLDAAAAGLLLVDPDGSLQVMATTSAECQVVEELQVESGAGPCVDSYRTGTPVAVDDIAATTSRWPAFAACALSQGFGSLLAVPMRLRSRTVGSLALFSHGTGPFPAEDAAITQAFADMATIALLQERAAKESVLINEQLQRALNGRILIEQAKGMIAHTSNVDMGAAFALLRDYARSHNQTVYETADRIINNRKFSV
ncbi:GAF and ANTAR domain-containing protein [Arthrobacter sp. Hor0625]|uniref:GAF and ANTAR domain-containing protein n=1 Tax=Arthrobacter sp. Hor0625 TaxID=3457358 RepID=UPI00403E6376